MKWGGQLVSGVGIGLQCIHIFRTCNKEEGELFVF